MGFSLIMDSVNQAIHLALVIVKSLVAWYLVQLLFNIILRTRLLIWDLKDAQIKKANLVGAATVKTIRDGTNRYSPPIARGDISAAGQQGDREIEKLWWDYWRDLLNLIIATVTRVFKP